MRTHAQTVTVEKSTATCSSGGGGGSWSTIATVNPGDAINITGIDDSWTAIRVKSSTGGEAIGRVTLSGSRSGSSPLELFVAGINCVPASANIPVPSNQSAGSSWSGLTYGSNSDTVRDAVRLTAAIGGDLTGSVDCGSVFRLQAGGDIKSEVRARHADVDTGPAVGYVTASTIENDGNTTSGAVIADTGDIASVVVGTNLTAEWHGSKSRGGNDVVGAARAIAPPLGARAMLFARRSRPSVSPDPRTSTHAVLADLAWSSRCALAAPAPDTPRLGTAC